MGVIISNFHFLVELMSTLSPEQIFRYWKEFDLYDIPEWSDSGDFASYTGNHLTGPWTEKFQVTIKAFDEKQKKREWFAKRNKEVFKQEYKALQIYLQCHEADYLLKDDHRKNYVKKRKLYFLSFFVKVEIGRRTGDLQFSLLPEDEYWTFNRALLREMFRQSPHFREKSSNIRFWLEGVEKDIKEFVQETFKDCLGPDRETLPLIEVKEWMSNTNWEIARNWWKDAESKRLMASCTQVAISSIEPGKATNGVSKTKDGIPQFIWRWRETDTGSGVQQFGPFFVSDLDWLIKTTSEGTPLSKPLQSYIKGHSNSTILNDATKDAKTYRQLLGLDQLSPARWPSDPVYGLSTLQSLAVNLIANEAQPPPVVAVNGPPGTGKTTLLKEYVADQFVKRTCKVLKKKLSWGWASKESIADTINEVVRSHSIVVASSNNKAVENVSRELPALNSIHQDFQNEISFFKHLVPDSDWGCFSAVLGNASNRFKFIEGYSTPLKNYLEEIADPFSLRFFKNIIRKKPLKSFDFIGERWITRTQQEGVMQALKSQKSEMLASLASQISKDFTARTQNRESKYKFQSTHDWLTALKEESKKQLVLALDRLIGKLDNRKRIEKEYKQAVTAFEQKLGEFNSFVKQLNVLSKEIEKFHKNENSLKAWERKLEDQRLELRIEENTDFNSLATSVYDRKKVLIVEQETLFQQMGELKERVFQSQQSKSLLMSKLEIWKAWFPFFIKILITRRTHSTLLLEFDQTTERLGRYDEELQSKLNRLDSCKSEIFRNDSIAHWGEDRAKYNKQEDEHLQVHEPLKAKLKALNFEEEDWLETLIVEKAWEQREDETTDEAEARIQKSSPWGTKSLNILRSDIFIKALRVNEKLIELGAEGIAKGIGKTENLLRAKSREPDSKNAYLFEWSTLFFCFPVISTTFASAARQFCLMAQPETIGTLIIDEAGQASALMAAGLLQRSKQALVVGDPMQLQPVVTLESEIDHALAREMMETTDLKPHLRYLINNGSVQTLADEASPVKSKIGNTVVGVPLLVHRRCDDPMFSISNQLSYGGKMIQGKPPSSDKLDSSFIHVEGHSARKYENAQEVDAAWNLFSDIVLKYEKECPIYVITPFTAMAKKLRKEFKMRIAASAEIDQRVNWWGKPENWIGTVHTFQGKEAPTVILCLACTPKETGGVQWVNSAPNLLNVAVTRAKRNLFITGNLDIWKGTSSVGVLYHHLDDNA